MSFILDHGHYEWELVQGNTTYDKSNFSTGTLSEAVFQQFTIGSVAARQLNLTMWNCPLNTTDPIQLVCKAVASDGTVTTIQKGVYFIDTIDTSPYSEYCEVTAFDAMLKTETVYMKSGVYTPKTALQLVQEIAGDIGVQVEADTVTYITSHNFNFTEVPKIGTKDGTTDREILSVIGIWYGGNWIINDANELELLLADGAMYGVTLLTVGEDGLFYSLPIAYAEGGVMVVENDAQGLMNTMDFADVTDTTVLYYFDVQGRSCIGTLAEIQAEGESDLAVEVGDEVVDFDISPIEIIKRIEIEKDNNTIYRCPEGLTDEEWDALGGRCISVTMPLMASQEVANRLYDQLYGLSYLPYQASGAYFDPDTRLGRVLHIKDRLVPLFNRTLTIDQLGESNCIIEAEQRLQSFYPYLDPVVRTMNRDISTAQETADAAAQAAGEAQATAESASARQQTIYISVPSGTIPSANTTWVTNTSGAQNTWTTKRPVYNSSYPVLYIATQAQTVEQRSTSACSCTTPMIDDTTTIIDGGHITTGTIDANVVTVANINASNISTGTLSADRISAHSVPVGKLSGSMTGGLSNSWGIDFTTGTLTIGNISAANITTGTMTANRISGGTLTLGGQNNTNGLLRVLNASGTEIGKWDNTGATITGNLTINYNDTIFGIGTMEFVDYFNYINPVVNYDGLVMDLSRAGKIGWLRRPSSVLYQDILQYALLPRKGCILSIAAEYGMESDSYAATTHADFYDDRWALIGQYKRIGSGLPSLGKDYEFRQSINSQGLGVIAKNEAQNTWVNYELSPDRIAASSYTYNGSTTKWLFKVDQYSGKSRLQLGSTYLTETQLQQLLALI